MDIDLRAEQDPLGTDCKYLTFFTDKQLFGIPIEDVVQIVGLQEITPIPEFPSYAKGIINLRGNIVPLIDMRLRFHKDEAEYNERTCIIVTNIDLVEVGLIVDGVNEVTQITREQVSRPPHMNTDRDNSYIIGIGKLEHTVVLLLNTAKILQEQELETLSTSYSLT